MNRPQAIEILTLNVKVAGKRMPPDVRDAVKVGVESIEFIERNATILRRYEITPLPGETKD